VEHSKATIWRKELYHIPQTKSGRLFRRPPLASWRRSFDTLSARSIVLWQYAFCRLDRKLVVPQGYTQQVRMQQVHKPWDGTYVPAAVAAEHGVAQCDIADACGPSVLALLQPLQHVQQLHLRQL
jgi:hypothetical protein